MRRTRAERRHHHRRMLNRAKDIPWIKDFYTGEINENLLRRVAENPKICSCDGCRNPRTNQWAKGKEKLPVCERRMTEVDIYEDLE